MFLIPYIYNKKESAYNIYIYHIFLNKGTLFIQLDETDIDSFLEINEFFYTKKTILNDYCYVEIDVSKTHINSFYSYIDNDDAECWRRFLLVENDILHVNNTNPEFIQPILNKLQEIHPASIE